MPDDVAVAASGPVPASIIIDDPKSENGRPRLCQLPIDNCRKNVSINLQGTLKPTDERCGCIQKLIGLNFSGPQRIADALVLQGKA